MSTNIVWHEGRIKPEERHKILKQKGAVLWFTGLSGSGKSTIAGEVEKELISRGRLAYRLDGDNIRHGLNSDLGFSEEDREENIRRIATVAALFADTGLITLVSVIAPFQRMRNFARKTAAKHHFYEIYVKASLDICVERDPKGLYRKALNGEIKNFTGISAPYEAPENPEILLDTDYKTPSESAHIVLKKVLPELILGE
jgi:adenylyl-sulfate kinase